MEIMSGTVTRQRGGVKREFANLDCRFAYTRGCWCSLEMTGWLAAKSTARHKSAYTALSLTLTRSMVTWSNIGYDSLNRLSSAAQTPVGGSAQYFCWSYDSFGNRLNQAVASQPFANSVGASCQPSGTYTKILSRIMAEAGTIEFRVQMQMG